MQQTSRKQSIFASTKQSLQSVASGIEDTITIYNKAIKVVAEELDNTLRTNQLENDAEYYSILSSQIEAVIEALATLTDSKVDQLKAKMLNKRLEKLESLL